jgi:hypothetical protein
MSSVKRNNVETFTADPQSERHAWTGEHKLARAVILNGLREAAHAPYPHQRADALSWLLSDSTEPCSFFWWLSFLTDDVEGISSVIRKKVDLNQIKTRSAQCAEGQRTISEEHRAAIGKAITNSWKERKRRRHEERVAKLAALMNLRKNSTT